MTREELFIRPLGSDLFIYKGTGDKDPADEPVSAQDKENIDFPNITSTEHTDLSDIRPAPESWFEPANDPCNELVRCLKDKPEILVKLRKVIEEDDRQKYDPYRPGGLDYPQPVGCTGTTFYWQFDLKRNLILWPPNSCFKLYAYPGTQDYINNVNFLKNMRARCFNKVVIRQGAIRNILAALEAGYKMQDIIPEINCCAICDINDPSYPPCSNPYSLSLDRIIRDTKRLIFCKSNPDYLSVDGTTTLRDAMRGCAFPEYICDGTTLDPCEPGKVQFDIPYHLPDTNGAGFFCYYIDEPKTDKGRLKSCFPDENTCPPDKFARLKQRSQAWDIMYNNRIFTPLVTGEWEEQRLEDYRDIPDGYSYTAYHTNIDINWVDNPWDQRLDIETVFNKYGGGQNIRDWRDYLDGLVNMGRQDLAEQEARLRAAQRAIEFHLPWPPVNLHKLNYRAKLPYQICWIAAHEDNHFIAKHVSDPSPVHEYELLLGHANRLGMLTAGIFAGSSNESCESFYENADRFLNAARNAG